MIPWEIRASGPWGSLEMKVARCNRDEAWRIAFHIVSYLGGIDIGTWQIRPVGSKELTWETIS